METELDYTLIGVRLRAARQRRGYTQEYTAEQAGLSAQHVSGVECGHAKVSLPALVRLCNVLDTTPNHVLMDSVEHATPQILDSVAAVFADCSPDETYIILTQADNLKKTLRHKHFRSCVC